MGSRALGPRRRSGAAQPISFADAASTWLPRAIEFLWLATVALVPLVFAPEGFMLFFDVPKVAALRVLTGFILLLWTIEWAIKPSQRTFSTEDGLWNGFKTWIGTDVTRWLLVFAALFLIANVLSTLLSPVMSISLWGNSPGRDGFSLYSTASVIILFVVIAARLRTAEQLKRILMVIAFTAAIIAFYGILQRFGVVPLYDSVINRIQGTFGNALFAGAYFTLTIPITAGLALSQTMKPRPVWVHAGWMIILAAQITALVLTLSRGPWIATAAAVTTWLIVLLVISEGRAFAKAAITLGVALSIAIAVSFIPAPDLGSSGDDSGLISGRASSIGSDLTVGGLNGRIAIWKRAMTIAAERPWFDDSQSTPAIVRHLFGYGQDMFLYATPVIWASGLERTVNASAHNYPIHILIELGILGLIAFGGLIVVAVIGGGNLLLKNRRSVSREHAVVFVALLAAVVGRVVEQTTGVARISDMTIFWAILGLAAAMSAMIRSGSFRNIPAPNTSSIQKSSWNNAPALRWSIALVVLIVLSALVLQKNANSLRAASLGASSVETFQDGSLLTSLQIMDDAIAAAPDVELYYKIRADMMNSFGTRDKTDEIEIAEEQYLLSKRALEANPLSHIARLSLASSALRLAELGQDGRANEALSLYEELGRMVAGSDDVYIGLAVTYLTLGEPHKALEMLDKFTIVTNGELELPPKAAYLRGEIHRSIGNTSEAIAFFEDYLKSQSAGPFAAPSHLKLAEIYAELGQQDQHAEHFAIYEQMRRE